MRDAILRCPDLETELAAFGEDALPGMLRLALLDKYPGWQDAIGAESIMAFVLERADAEILDYWQAKVPRDPRRDVRHPIQLHSPGG